LTKRLRDDFPILAEIEDMAEDRGIEICEAFQGTQVGAFTILAPSRQRYLELIPQLSRTPAAKDEAGLAAAAGGGFFTTVLQRAKAAVEWIAETWGGETLEEDVETSASNESSVVQLADFGGKKVLLTGDAGIVALKEAADYAETVRGITLPGLHFVQMPHHGSRHNVSPSILDRWLGKKLGPQGETRNITCFASVGKEADTHPRRKVRNAFIRRGASIFVTKGQTIRHQSGMPARDGWTALTPLEFSDEVEN
jgi:hypothetical protein